MKQRRSKTLQREPQRLILQFNGLSSDAIQKWFRKMQKLEIYCEILCNKMILIQQDLKIC